MQVNYGEYIQTKILAGKTQVNRLLLPMWHFRAAF